MAEGKGRGQDPCLHRNESASCASPPCPRSRHFVPGPELQPPPPPPPTHPPSTPYSCPTHRRPTSQHRRHRPSLCRPPRRQGPQRTPWPNQLAWLSAALATSAAKRQRREAPPRPAAATPEWKAGRRGPPPLLPPPDTHRGTKRQGVSTNPKSPNASKRPPFNIHQGTAPFPTLTTGASPWTAGLVSKAACVERGGAVRKEVTTPFLGQQDRITNRKEQYKWGWVRARGGKRRRCAAQRRRPNGSMNTFAAGGKGPIPGGRKSAGSGASGGSCGFLGKKGAACMGGRAAGAWGRKGAGRGRPSALPRRGTSREGTAL